MIEIKWYMWLWLWLIPNKSVTDISEERGMELRTTIWFKEYKGTMYIVKEKFTLTEARGRSARKLRNKNKGLK